jgi:hypothetical protein
MNSFSSKFAIHAIPNHICRDFAFSTRIRLQETTDSSASSSLTVQHWLDPMAMRFRSDTVISSSPTLIINNSPQSLKYRFESNQ